jgi:hypothetical protein
VATVVVAVVVDVAALVVVVERWRNAAAFEREALPLAQLSILLLLLLLRQVVLLVQWIQTWREHSELSQQLLVQPLPLA